MEGAGFLPFAPLFAPLPPPPVETTTQVINNANRASTDSSTALRRQ
ncbi:hypothetical protein SALBM217S_07343 [Streptomyces griseoloalbus]